MSAKSDQFDLSLEDFFLAELQANDVVGFYIPEHVHVGFNASPWEESNIMARREVPRVFQVITECCTAIDGNAETKH